MDFKFEKHPAGDEAPQGGQDKGRQTVLLVVLVLLLGGFGYLYFFTDLIRPQEKPAPPQPVPQVVKKPLPAREGAPAAEPGTPAAAKPAEPPKPQPAQGPAPAAAPVPPTAAKPAPAPAPQAAVKPAPAPQPAKPEEKKPAPAVAKPADQKPTPAAAKPEAPKPVAASKPVPKPEEKKPAVAKAEEKKAPAVKAAVEKPKHKGPWTLVVGSYVVEERLAADMTKVKAAGLTPAIVAGGKRATTMHRLFYGEYPDRAAAQQAVDQVKRQGGDAFSVQKGGKHEVYAGSYALLESAKAEQQRLAAAGVKVTIQKTQVGVATRKLTAGSFSDRAVAEVALKKLKKAAVGTPVLE